VRRLLLLFPLICLVACGGGPPGDVFIVKRDGSVPGAKLRLQISDDGGAYCNNGDRRDITSDQLIEAREIRRILNGDPRKPEEVPGVARKNLSLPPNGPTIYSYEVRSEEGTFNFHDSSRGQPVTSQIIRLTRDIAKQACGLAR
jgi:hypothetical protein